MLDFFFLIDYVLVVWRRKLVESPYKESVDWSKWLIFWVDERVVPLDDPDSNYLLASLGFLSKVVSNFSSEIQELLFSFSTEIGTCLLLVVMVLKERKKQT